MVTPRLLAQKEEKWPRRQRVSRNQPDFATLTAKDVMNKVRAPYDEGGDVIASLMIEAFITRRDVLRTCLAVNSSIRK